MTFQVACIGRDGFLIASDRNGTKDEGDSVTVRKIVVSEDGGLVCSFSGDRASAATIGQRIAYSLRRPDDLSSTPKIWRFLEQFIPEDESTIRLFVGIPNAPPYVDALWRVSFQNKKPEVIAMSDKECIGFNSMAKYFVERYYRADLSVDQLTVLAGHAVLEAHAMNSLVKGLDILVAKRSDNPRFLDSGELDKIRDQSAVLHRGLGEALFPVR